MISIQVSVRQQQQHDKRQTASPSPAINIQVGAARVTPPSSHSKVVLNGVPEPALVDEDKQIIPFIDNESSYVATNAFLLNENHKRLLRNASDEEGPLTKKSKLEDKTALLEGADLEYECASLFEEEEQDFPIKMVRFADPESLEQEIATDSDSHEYNCQERWYNRAEYKGFRQDMKMNFFMHSLLKAKQGAAGDADASSPSSQNTICIRGLERYCFFSQHKSKEAATSNDMRIIRQNAVLDQQRIQAALGEKNPMTLRLVAEILSRRVCEEAQELGQQDARSAAEEEAESS